MRYYEAIYIAHPNLEQDDLIKLIEETKGMVSKRGGEILYEEVMGKKRLAYPIQKQRYGTYVLLQFRADGSGNAHLNQDLELNDHILAHMVVRIDEDEIREAARTEVAEEELVAKREDEPVAKMEVEIVEAEQQDPEQPEVETLLEEEIGAEATASSEEENLEPETPA